MTLLKAIIASLLACVLVFTADAKAVRKSIPSQTQPNPHTSTLIGDDEETTPGGNYDENQKEVRDSSSTSTKIFRGDKAPADKRSVPSEEDESDAILSFNFLYYLIQKFKFSDIIDH